MKIGDSVALSLLTGKRYMYEHCGRKPWLVQLTVWYMLSTKELVLISGFLYLFFLFFSLRTKPSNILWTCSWRVKLSCLWDVIIFNNPYFSALFICEPHIVHLLPYVCVSCAHTCNYRDSVCVNIISICTCYLPGSECSVGDRAVLKCYMLNPRWLWLLKRGWLEYSRLPDPTRLHWPRDHTCARGGGAQDPWAWLAGAHLGSSHHRG